MRFPDATVTPPGDPPSRTCTKFPLCSLKHSTATTPAAELDRKQYAKGAADASAASAAAWPIPASSSSHPATSARAELSAVVAAYDLSWFYRYSNEFISAINGYMIKVIFISACLALSNGMMAMGVSNSAKLLYEDALTISRRRRPATMFRALLAGKTERRRHRRAR